MRTDTGELTQSGFWYWIVLWYAAIPIRKCLETAWCLVDCSFCGLHMWDSTCIRFLQGFSVARISVWSKVLSTKFHVRTTRFLMLKKSRTFPNAPVNIIMTWRRTKFRTVLLVKTRRIQEKTRNTVASLYMAHAFVFSGSLQMVTPFGASPTIF